MSDEDKPTNKSISSEDDVQITDDEEDTPPKASSILNCNEKYARMYPSFFKPRNKVVPSDDPVNHQEEEPANESENPLNPSQSAEPLMEDGARPSTSSSPSSNNNNEPSEPESPISNPSPRSNLYLEMLTFIRRIQPQVSSNLPANLRIKMVSRIKNDYTFNISVECNEIPSDETEPENNPGSSNGTRADSRSAVSSDSDDRQINVDIRQPQKTNESAASSSTLDTCETKAQETNSNPTTEYPSSSVSSNVNQSANTNSMSNTSNKKINETSSSKPKRKPLTQDHEINEVKQCIISVLEFLISSLNSTASNRELLRAVTNAALETIITIEEEVEEPTLVNPNENQVTQNGSIQPNQRANSAEYNLDAIPSTSSYVVNPLDAIDGIQNQELQPRNQSINASYQSILDNFRSKVVNNTAEWNRSQARSRMLRLIPVALNMNILASRQFANTFHAPFVVNGQMPSLRNINMPLFNNRRRNLHQYVFRPEEEEINNGLNNANENNGNAEGTEENQPSVNSRMPANPEDFLEIDPTSVFSSDSSFTEDEDEEEEDEEEEDEEAEEEKDDEDDDKKIGLKEKCVEPQSLQKSSGSTKTDGKSDAYQPEENYDALNNTVVDIEQPVQENQSTVPVDHVEAIEIDPNSVSSPHSLIVDIKKKECVNTQIKESPNNSTPTNANLDTDLPSQKNDTSNTAIENDKKPSEENVHTLETNISTNQVEATNVTSVTSPKSVIIYKDEEVHMDIQSLLFDDATASTSTNPDNRQSKRKYKTTTIPSAFKVEQKQKRLCTAQPSKCKNKIEKTKIDPEFIASAEPGPSKSNVASEKSQSSNKPTTISTNLEISHPGEDHEHQNPANANTNELQESEPRSLFVNPLVNQSELTNMVSNTTSLSNTTNTTSYTEVNLASDQQQKVNQLALTSSNSKTCPVKKEDNTQNVTTSDNEKSSSEDDLCIIHESILSNQEEVIVVDEPSLSSYINNITKNKKGKSTHRSQPSTSTSSSSNTGQLKKREKYDNSSSVYVHKKTRGKQQRPIPTDPLKLTPEIIEIDSDVEYLPRYSIISSPFKMNTSKPSTSSSSYSETRQSNKNNNASNFITSKKIKQKYKYRALRNVYLEEEDVIEIDCEPNFPDYSSKVAKQSKKCKDTKEPQPSTASCAYRPKEKKKAAKKTISKDQEDSKPRSYSYDSLANREEMIEINSDSLSITSTVSSNDEIELQMNQTAFRNSSLNARRPNENDDTSNNTSTDESQ